MPTTMMEPVHFLRASSLPDGMEREACRQLRNRLRSGESCIIRKCHQSNGSSSRVAVKALDRATRGQRFLGTAIVEPLCGLLVPCLQSSRQMPDVGNAGLSTPFGAQPPQRRRPVAGGPGHAPNSAPDERGGWGSWYPRSQKRDLGHPAFVGASGTGSSMGVTRRGELGCSG